MTRTTLLLRRFAASEGGATAIEYGLLLALISLVAIGTLTSAIGTSFTAVLNRIVAAV